MYFQPDHQGLLLTKINTEYMKMSTVGIVTPINKEEMNELLRETKEILATGLLKNKNTEIFGVVNMWKVRKAAKSASSMRRHFS